MKAPLSLIFILFIFSSCQPIMMKMAGMNNIKSFDSLKYEEMAEKLYSNYPGPKNSYAISDSAMLNYSALFDTTFQKNTFQPIQLLYFKNKDLTSYHANCFAPGINLKHLDWNTEGRFDHYIPKSAVDLEKYSIGLDQLIKAIQSPVDQDKILNKDVVVFFWTRMVPISAKDLNEIMVKNATAYSKDNLPYVIYLNTDKFMSKASN